MARIYAVSSGFEISIAKELFQEYAAGLGFSLCFQGFDKELAELPGAYSPPRGCLLLAEVDGTHAGCIALRPRDETTCEMKRLYVRPHFRGTGLGRSLVNEILDEARQRGYQRIVLDTLPQMESAIRMYRHLGFTEIPPYYENNIPGALFLELRFDQRRDDVS
jgi:ribosomal protein S18 acetylase RimI-like enzyme